MKLREFYEEYLESRNRKRGDMFHAFYKTNEDRRRGRIHSINEDEIANAYRNGGLIMEADTIRTSKEEGEGSSVSFTGQGTEFRFTWYCAEIDADQAQIALNIHPALRKPSRTASPKNKTKKRAKGHRFTL